MFVSLTRANVAHLKTRLIDRMPGVRSGHADEAIASGLGFRTHAALLASMSAPDASEVIVALNESQLIGRLRSLGYYPDPPQVVAALAGARLPGGTGILLNCRAEEVVSILWAEVESLSDNTNAARRTIYEKMRAALARDLRTIVPPLKTADVLALRRVLEDGIRRVEEEASRVYAGRAAMMDTIDKLRGKAANQN